MSDFIEFLTSEEVIIVGLIAAVGLILTLIVYIIEKTYHKRKRRNNTKELNNLVSDIEEKIVQEKEHKVTPIVDNNIVEDVIPITKNEVAKEVTPTFEEKKVETPLVIPIEEVKPSESAAPASVEEIYKDVKEEVEILEAVKDKKKDELQYTDIEPNPEEAKEELRKVTEELIKKEEENNDNNIELTEFEALQEENAIISIDELMAKGDSLYEQNEITQYEDEGNEPISLQDLETRMSNIKEEIEKLDKEEPKVEEISSKEISPNKVVLDDFNTIKTDNLYRDDVTFKSSPIISPIFGIEDRVGSNDIELENTANYDKFDQEIKKTNEFIVTLKELQKKLD